MYDIGDLIITKDGKQWVLGNVGYSDFKFGAVLIGDTWAIGGYDSGEYYDNWEDVIDYIDKKFKVTSHHPKGSWRVVTD